VIEEAEYGVSKRIRDAAGFIVSSLQWWQQVSHAKLQNINML
jgi:hypothetical protein